MCHTAGPKEGAIALAWHPLRTSLLSIATTGRVYIWARHYAENWSAFAPDFKVGGPGTDFFYCYQILDAALSSRSSRRSNSRS